MATPATSTSTKKSKVRKSVVRGIVHINASFNNTMVAITDTNGDVIAQDSAGTVGFKGARKSTPFAASRASEKAVSKARARTTPCQNSLMVDKVPPRVGFAQLVCKQASTHARTHACHAVAARDVQ